MRRAGADEAEVAKSGGTSIDSRNKRNEIGTRAKFR